MDCVCVAAWPAKFSQINARGNPVRHLPMPKSQNKLRASPSTSSSPSMSRIDRPWNGSPLTTIPLVELSWQTMVIFPVSATTLQRDALFQTGGNRSGALWLRSRRHPRCRTRRVRGRPRIHVPRPRCRSDHRTVPPTAVLAVALPSTADPCSSARIGTHSADTRGRPWS